MALGLYRRWRDQPIARLREAGVKVTVSTEDAPFFHTTMEREHARLADAFGWDEADLAELHRTAAQAAFCDEATRERLLERIDADAG